MGVRNHLQHCLQQARNWVFFRLLRKKKEARLRRFCDVMRPAAGESLLDIGAGAGAFWRQFASQAGPSVGTLRMVGIDLIPIGDFSVFRNRLVADARRLPFKDKAFDIVFSNSVIEHVGAFEQQQRMAREIERVGRRYFVQVPARCFPIEAHYFIPFLSYLPVRWQVAITRTLFGEADPIHLPTLAVAKRLFPGATIETERMFGITKCYLIYRA